VEQHDTGRTGEGRTGEEQLRNVRLLFDPELSSGALAGPPLLDSALLEAVRPRSVPSRPLRVVQQLRYKLRGKPGGLDYERAVAEPLAAVRRSVLGAAAAAPPRFLVRVDEFPNAAAWDDDGPFGTSAYQRFHEIMASAGVPYLVAVLPRVNRDPLAPSVTESRALSEGELAMLRRLARERVSFALHGLDHSTRSASPRRHSELCGLDRAQTEALLEQGMTELGRHDIRPDVFVPPYNRFDAAQWASLASRFSVVCGGPESIGLMGFQGTPQWRGDAVYLPSYMPFYGRAGELLEPVQRAIDRALGLWVPLVLHWGWEAEARWHELERLAALLAPSAASWEDFHAAVQRSRARMPADREEETRTGMGQEAQGAAGREAQGGTGWQSPVR
jgi:hypothetical protein